MTKASLIRELVARGYSAKSPNTLRRWPIEQLQALLASMPALVEQVPVEPISQEMQTYVEAASPIVIPTDRELYAAALQVHPVPVIAPPVVSGLERWLALCLAPWTFVLKFAGIA